MHGFVAKYDPNGEHVWSKDFVSNAGYDVAAVAVERAHREAVAP
jgi:hypothetical protein